MVAPGKKRPAPDAARPPDGAADADAASKDRRRAQEEFAARDQSGLSGTRYTYFNDANLHFAQERERHLLALLRRFKFEPDRLVGARVLSVGCGIATELVDMTRYGASAQRLFGVDIEAGRVHRAKARNPAFGILRADTGALPFASSSFDLVLQFTLFTSVLDPELRRVMAFEMLRVLHPDGMIVWYDFWPNNPANPHVRGIRMPEIESLFPGCWIESRRLTLPPPLARRVVPASWLLGDLLARIPWLQTFHLAAIGRR